MSYAKKLSSLLLVLTLLIGFGASAAAAPAVPAAATTAAQTAASWLRGAQQADGGFGPALKGPSTLGQSTDAAFAFAASGAELTDVVKGGKSLLAYLVANGATASSPAAACKVALVGRGYLPKTVFDAISKAYDKTTATFGKTTLDQAYCLLQSRTGAPQEEIDALKKLQLADGSFAFAGLGAAGEGDSNTTALVMQSLAANGVAANDAAITQAVAYLKTQQNDDGGFPYQKPSQYGTDTDANSTAYVIQGLLAAGLDPAGFKSAAGNDPLAALLKLQNPDGAFRFQGASGEDNVLATLQAIPALRYASLPIAIPDAAGSAAVSGTPVVVNDSSMVATPPSTPRLPRTGSSDYGWPLTLFALALSGLVGGLLLRPRRRRS